VVHHIEVCSYPNWIGDAQERFATLDGDLLTLSTKPMTFQGVERTVEFLWEASRMTSAFNAFYARLPRVRACV
jgi:hypothetical protein